MAYTSDDLIALKKTINEIGFEDENKKTLMDRFREVRDDESLNKLHEEWKKFWKKRSLQLHPDKGGNDDEFIQFNEKKEIIDGFFDKYTINEEKAEVQKRKFIDEEHKQNFFITRNYFANTTSPLPSQSSSRSENQNNPTYGSQTPSENQNGQDSKHGRAPFGGQRNAGFFSSRNTRSDDDNFSDLNELLRKFFERMSEPSSTTSTDKNDLNSKQNNGNGGIKTNFSSNFYNQTPSQPDSSKTNYQSTEGDKVLPQNRSNQFEDGTGSFGNPTLVFLFITAQGVGLIFRVSENHIISEKENKNGSSTFASRFGGVNDGNTKKGSSRY